jgi:hypothetical protein
VNNDEDGDIYDNRAVEWDGRQRISKILGPLYFIFQITDLFQRQFGPNINPINWIAKAGFKVYGKVQGVNERGTANNGIYNTTSSSPRLKFIRRGLIRRNNSIGIFANYEMGIFLRHVRIHKVGHK